MDSKAVQQEGFATANYYRVYIKTKNIQPEEVNMENLKTILGSIPLESESHYYFIIPPGDKNIYVSNPSGSISDFVLKYRDYFYNQSNGILYESFGVDEQLYTYDIKDTNGQTWYIGFKYPVVDLNLLTYFVQIIILVLIAYSIFLYIWAHNISNNLIRISNSLKDILDTKNSDKNRILPLVSNDEFSDLSYYYNKIQELTAKNIEQIHENQSMLMESERLASLGQLIGGIAHNLKTPIMSIAGATEGIDDLIKEYDASIDNPQVTSQDHHDIAKDMNSWTIKIKEYTAYMSDIITAVKGQAVVMSEADNVTFDIEELVKRVNILMRHELKNAIVYLNVIMKVPEHTILHGDINSLVQVINNMISNSIQAYAGKPEQKIDFIQSYERASNAATGSKYDPNANVTTKNIATMATELPKKDMIDLNRELMRQKLTEEFGPELADQYIKDLKSHIIYKHDETSIFPYCCSISLYPFVLNGLTKLSGTSGAPKHADSFCGSFINLVFCVAAQFAGATATPEFLTYLDHFLRIDYGQDYYKRLDKVIEFRVSGDLTLKEKIENTPTSASRRRGRCHRACSRPPLRRNRCRPRSPCRQGLS